MSKRRRRARSGRTRARPTRAPAALRPRTGPRCALRGDAVPIASSVFYLETIDNGGAPTLVMERRLGDHEENAAGWLCAPRANRLLTFDGSLLHCVVPPIPAPADAARRRHHRDGRLVGPGRHRRRPGAPVANRPSARRPGCRPWPSMRRHYARGDRAPRRRARVAPRQGSARPSATSRRRTSSTRAASSSAAAPSEIDAGWA